MAIFIASYEDTCTECSVTIYPDDKAAFLGDHLVCVPCFDEASTASLGFSL